MIVVIPPECALFSETHPTFGGWGTRFADDASELQVFRSAQHDTLVM
jgi:hypothetical protein